MHPRRLMFAVAAAFAALVLAAPIRASAQAPAIALSGTITSAQEGPMEGVLVSAKKSLSTISVTVVSDANGRYAFPAARLEPGRYALSIRAIGFDLDGLETVDLAAQQAVARDLKLRKTEDLASQLSNGEWIASVPGNDAQK